jgi:hypothetical protein
MLILCTGKGTHTGDSLEPGKYYECSEDGSPTERQNRTFHALVSAWFADGTYSYPAKTARELKDWVKKDLGAGAERRVWITFKPDGKEMWSTGKAVTKADADPPENAARDFWGNYIYVDLLKSWADYTRKERTETVDRLVAAMIQSGCNSPKFEEILRGMEDPAKKEFIK